MTPAFCISCQVGEFGDCWRACIATILDLPTLDVPNFAHLAEGDTGAAHNLDMYRRGRAWLAPRGYSIFQNWCSGDWSLEKLLQSFSADNPGVPLILHGEPVSPGDISHAVVVLDGAIAHDPSGCGIKGPCLGKTADDPRWWWMDVISIAAVVPS